MNDIYWRAEGENPEWVKARFKGTFTGGAWVWEVTGGAWVWEGVDLIKHTGLMSNSGAHQFIWPARANVTALTGVILQVGDAVVGDPQLPPVASLQAVALQREGERYGWSLPAHIPSVQVWRLIDPIEGATIEGELFIEKKA